MSTVFLFSTSFTEHSRITGQQRKMPFKTPLYQFLPLHGHLDISRVLLQRAHLCMWIETRATTGTLSFLAQAPNLLNHSIITDANFWKDLLLPKLEQIRPKSWVFYNIRKFCYLIFPEIVQNKISKNFLFCLPTQYLLMQNSIYGVIFHGRVEI